MTVSSGEEMICAHRFSVRRTVRVLPRCSKRLRGVEITARERNGISYLFVLNHTDQEQMVGSPYRSHDLISGRTMEPWTTIDPYDVYVLIAT